MHESPEFLKFYRQFAEKTGRVLRFTEIPVETSISATQRMMLHKRTVTIPLDASSEVLFYAYHDPMGLVGRFYFSGVFCRSIQPLTTHLSVRKKNIIDRINIFGSRKGVIKTGTQYDNEVYITTREDDQPDISFLHRKEIQNVISKVHSIDERFFFGVNDVMLTNAEPLHSGSVFGFYIIKDWIFDEEMIGMIHAEVLKLKGII
ncbi:MAG: hypothetical protein R6V49_10255 [Bacteroidales bacterium]